MTNVYSLTVASDGNCTPSGSGASALGAGSPEIGALAGASDYSHNQMGLHAINVPAGAQSVRVNVEADADVAILAHRDVAPTPAAFTHFQDIPGAANEELILAADSSGPLTPGLWYVRVLNNSENAISYSITATGDLTEEVDTLSVQAEVVDGRLRLNWNVIDEAAYVVQSSNDLAAWSDVAEIPAGSSSFVLPNVSGPARFYRVVRTN
jgi:hypothetical protein